MARLPSEMDMERRAMPAQSPGVTVRPVDFSPVKEAANSVAGAVQAFADAQGAVDDYETNRRLLDFKLNSEMALEEAKREMQPGGSGFSETWAKSYRKQAESFVGKGDSNIRPEMRAKIGMALKQQEVMLGERAQRYELGERDRFHIDDLQNVLGRTRDMVTANPSERDRWMTEGHRLIDQSQIPIPDKYRLKQHFGKEVDKAYGEGLVQGIQSKEDLDKVRDLIAPNMPDRRGEKAALRGVAVGERQPDGMSIITAGSGAKFRAHGDYADRFAGLVNDLEAAGVSIKGDQSGGYANRNIAGTTTKSRHASGEAIDINWSENGRGARGSLADQLGPDTIREIAAKNGLKWGGDWRNPDDMHFEVDRGSSVRPVSRRGLTQFAGLNGSEPAPESYRGPMQSLSVDERRAIFRRGEERYGKMVKDAETIIKEQMSVAGDGYVPPKAIMDELEKRVIALNDPMLNAQYATMLGKAELTQRFQKAPPLAIEEVARRERDAAAKNGATKEQDLAIKHVEQLAASVRKSVNDNAMGWAQRVQLEVPMADGPPADLEPSQRARWQMPKQTVQLEQLNFGAPDVDMALARRAEQAKGVGRYYGQAPQMFTTNERDFLKDVLAQGGEPMLQIMGKISGAATKAGIDPAQVMREFSKDAPEVATIGEMVANNADRTLLDTASKALAWKAGMKEKFESTIDKTQAKPDMGELADVLATQPTRVDAVKHTTNLLYEYEARRQGKTQFDNDLYKDIAARVMGQTKDGQGNLYGGVGAQGTGWGDGKWASGGFFGSTPKVLVPAEVRQDRFDDMVGALRATDLPDPPRDGSGQPLPMRDIRRATWVSLGPGRYALELSKDTDGTRVMAMTTGGQPYVLDIRPILPAIQRRKPEIFRGYDENKTGVSEPDPAYGFGFGPPPKK